MCSYAKFVHYTFVGVQEIFAFLHFVTAIFEQVTLFGLCDELRLDWNQCSTEME